MTGMIALVAVFAILACCHPLLGLLAVAPWVIETCWEALR